MRQAVFVERRRSGWQRLELLLDTAERRGLRALPAEEIEELGRLYRWVTSDLAFAEGRAYDVNLRAYLHRLTARSHAYVYAGNVEGGWKRVGRFLAHDFPSEVRRSRWYILACAALTVVAAVTAYSLIMASPTNAYVILPDEMIRPIHEKIHDSNFGFDRNFSSTMSAAIMTNNIKVAILAFGAGIVTLGLLTLYLVFFNGLMVGGLGAMYTNAGFGYDFWATIAPHGVIELTAIQIAAAAGLLMAAAVLNPGRLRRVDALVRNSRRALVLMIGVMVMLGCAALIEGFVSPQRFTPELRLGFGAITALALVYYFGFAGRGKDESAEHPLDATPELRSDVTSSNAIS
ncbi:MAG TPA: stage II sporulation protein M [Candidatus Eremiobacteraceae bacterium]|jgi:uncharacterized membrane protein SpoIIM required for sporulation|nr:stage II sporulation protein M [Candidatus Eremiobacteraceae bacterium]